MCILCKIGERLVTVAFIPVFKPHAHKFYSLRHCTTIVYYTPTHREGAILQSPCLSGNLYRVSPFQAYHTSTSCLQCDLEFFMFAVMKTIVTDISASTGRNDFIFDMWLWHGDLYHVSPFQVYCTSTSCLPCDLRIVHVFAAFSGNEC